MPRLSTLRARIHGRSRPDSDSAYEVQTGAQLTIPKPRGLLSVLGEPLGATESFKTRPEAVWIWETMWISVEAKSRSKSPTAH